MPAFGDNRGFHSADGVMQRCATPDVQPVFASFPPDLPQKKVKYSLCIVEKTNHNESDFFPAKEKMRESAKKNEILR